MNPTESHRYYVPISYAEADHGQHNDDHADDQLKLLVLLLVLKARVLVVQGYVHIAQDDVQIFACTRERKERGWITFVLQRNGLL